MVTKLERTSLSAQMYVHTRFEKTSPSVHSISHEQKKENRYFHIIKIILPLVGCTFSSIPPQALLFRHVSVPSRNGAVLSRRPVAERRHLSRVLCGFTCPLRYAPSESAAAGTIRLRYGGR